MNFELAKELKDAGFPHTESGKYIDQHNYILLHSSGQLGTANDWCYVPTLSELIEACGEEFMLTNECGMWEAWSNIGAKNTWPARLGETGAEHQYEGSTPIEAVARLWLALNKHEPLPPTS